MIRITMLLFCIGFALTVGAQGGQTKEDLQRKNQQLLKEIEEVKKDLEATERNKKQSLGMLRNIEKKINIRNQIISNIKGEVYLVEKEIIRTYRDIDTLKKELATLREQYAQSVIYAYKSRSNYDFLNFLFSANNFGDALRRVNYLKTYRSYRAQKSADILNTQKQLEEKVASLAGKREQKTLALNQESVQMKELEVEKREKDKVLAQISSQEKELRRMLANREEERKQLQNSIAAVIKREKDEALRREREEAKRKADANSAKGTTPTGNAAGAKTTAPPTATVRKREPSVLENTPEGLIRSQQFEENRGNLPWPVDRGTIILHFGTNKIPGLGTRPIEVVSDGITLEVANGSTVKAIFEGEVSSVFNVGDKQTVMVKHGKYYTIYSNLQNTAVSKGMRVSAGQLVGKAGLNDEGVGELSFEIHTERGAQNPENWLRRR